jgi:hypothetical protein
MQNFINLDLSAYRDKLREYKRKDDKLIEEYELAARGFDAKKRLAYRESHPEIDMALNFWGHNASLQSEDARNKLVERYQELHLSPATIPASVEGEKMATMRHIWDNLSPATQREYIEFINSEGKIGLSKDAEKELGLAHKSWGKGNFKDWLWKDLREIYTLFR